MSGCDVESGCFGGLFRKKRRTGLPPTQSDTAPYKGDLVSDVHYDEKVKAVSSPAPC